MSASLKGTFICFTGTLDGFSRAELIDAAAEYGFQFQISVTKKTNILVVGKNPGDGKLSKAREYGIKVWSGDDFLTMLGADDADGIAPPKPSPPPKSTLVEEKARLKFYAADEEVGMF